MCIKELWTYPECGCTVDHHIDCFDLENQSYQSPAHPLASSQGCEADASLSTTSAADPLVSFDPLTYAPKHESCRTQPRSSPINLLHNPSPSPPSTSDSDSEDNSNPEGFYHAHLRVKHPVRIRPTKPRVTSIKTQSERGDSDESKRRSCSPPPTMHKTFLEPICDDCLLDEIGVKRYSGVLPSVDAANDAQYAAPAQSQEEEEEEEQRGRNGHTRSGSGLIWSSDVKIEITPSVTSSTAPAPLHPAYMTGSSLPLIPHAPITHVVHVHDGTTSTTPSSTNTVPSAVDLSSTASLSLKPFSNLPPGISRFDSTQNFSIDLANRQPWLSKGSQACMRKNPEASTRIPEEEIQHEKEILESTVEVKILDTSGLVDALESELPSTRRLVSNSTNASIPDHADDDKSERAADVLASSSAARYRFTSAQFPHAPPVSPSSYNTDCISAAAYPFEISIPVRQPSTVSVSVSIFDGTDADDEASLHTSSPAPMLTPVPNPSPASLLPPTLIPDLHPVPDLDPDPPKTILSPNVTTRRPNTRTKALRRRGLDISRSSFALNALRLSSAWGSRERECLKGFREDILGRGREAEEVEGGGGDTRGDDVGRTHGRYEDSVRSGGHDGVVGGLRLSVRVREEPLEATLNEKDEGDNVRKQSMVGLEDKVPGHTEAKIEPPWSEDFLKSLEKVHVTNNFINLDNAELPSIKLHRTQASMKESSGTTVRGRSPVKTLLTRFTTAQTGGKTWAKGVLGDLKRSLSRDSRGRKHKAPNENESNLDPAGTARGSGAEDYERATAATTCTLRAVVDDAEKGNEGYHTDINACDRRGSRQTTTSQTTSTSISIGSGSVTEGNLYIHPRAAQSEISAQAASTESWQAHLSHDLAIPKATKKHIFCNAALSKSVTRLPSSTANYYAGKNINEPQHDTRRYSSAGILGKNWFARSSPVLPSGEESYEHGSGELKNRVLSTSTGPSVPGTASGMSSGTWVETDPCSVAGSGNWKGERLASIVSPEDFEQEEDVMGCSWAVPLDGVGDGTVVEGPLNTTPLTPESASECAKDRVSTQAENTNGQGQRRRLRSAPYPGHRTASMNNTTLEVRQSVSTFLERPRNPTPSSAPSFRFKPRLPPNQAMLAQHALSTPLRVSTPARAILPERTSSLSPPPVITPTRVGFSPGSGFTLIADVEEPEGPASGSPLTRTGRNDEVREEMAECEIEREGAPPKTKHMPTSNFRCVWKKYLCTGGCGGTIREEVESCFCERATGTGAIDAQGTVESGRVQCRSTAPVVRYVEGVCDVRTQDDNSHADHVGEITGGRCCLCEGRS